MGEVLSQSEIDNLLKQLNSGELDVEEMKILRKRRLRTMILPDLPNSQKNIFVRLKLYLNITEDCFRPIFLLTCVCRYRLRLRLPKP